MKNARRQWLNDLAKGSGRDLLRFLGSRLSNERDAEELAQEVYLRLLRVDDVSHIRNPRAFALRIAAHAAHEFHMLARNRLEHSSELLDNLESASDPATNASNREQMAILERALAQLSPKCRAVVLLHRRDQLTCKQIAEHMGLSVGMVKKYLAQGIATCQKQLASFMVKGQGAKP